MEAKVELFELNKGLGQLAGSGIDEATGFLPKAWKCKDDEVSLPAACVVLPLAQQNIDWMARYAKEQRMKLCPHVKTTMCPDLVERQMAKGAWGVTTATPHQTLVMHHFGIKRILMANQLVGKRNMEIISEILAKDPEFEFFCTVDSIQNLNDLTKFFEERNQKLNVLLEIGVPGGRTGIRGEALLAEMLSALKDASPTIVTRGIEFYEGVVKNVEEVRQFCQKAFEATLFLSLTFRENELKKIVISGGGSQWFDIVAEEMNRFRDAKYKENGFDGRTLITILRPGCYIVHDVGIYKEMENRVTQKSENISKGSLFPALRILAYVYSRPEPELAIIGMGKRDVAIDCGFPVPCSTPKTTKTGFRKWKPTPPTWEVTKVMDQHTFLRLPAEDKLNPGDIIAFNISHPCNTFSAWRHILLVDYFYNVLNIAPTYF